jgi:hypothetical protein
VEAVDVVEDDRQHEDGQKLERHPGAALRWNGTIIAVQYRGRGRRGLGRRATRR